MYRAAQKFRHNIKFEFKETSIKTGVLFFIAANYCDYNRQNKNKKIQLQRPC